MNYESLGFVKSPYDISDALLVDEKFLVWDRPDLVDVRTKLNHFIDNVIKGRRVGLKIFGPTGSGKTWSSRILRKEINERAKSANKHIAFIYTSIQQIEPEFSTIYRMAIDNFLENDFKFLVDHVKEKSGNTTAAAWEKIFTHKELIQIFARISSDWDSAEISRKWLRGEKMSTSEMAQLKFTYYLDGDYKRFMMLRDLLHELNKVFNSVVFVIDELENAPAKTSKAIGDSLRTLLDSFAINFALIATFTAEKEEEWYDFGYSEQLSRRFDYSVRLDSVKAEAIEDFIKTHNKLYLSDQTDTKDSLLPFKKDALKELLRLMAPEYHYPGFILPNCSILCLELFEKNQGNIDTKFVQDHQGILSYT